MTAKAIGRVMARWLGLLLLLMAVPALPEGRETLVWGASAWPPMVIVEEDKVVAGAEYEVVAELARRLELELVSLTCPWARCLALAHTGAIDILGSLARKPEREAFLVFIEPPYGFQSRQRFFVRQGEHQRLREYRDLYALTVGVSRGVRYFAPFDKDPRLTRVVLGNEQELLAALIAGRIDTFVVDQVVADYLINEKRGLMPIEWAEYTPVVEKFNFFGLSKHSRHSRQLERFNRTMAAMLADGTVERIMTRYGTEKEVSAAE